MIILVDMDDTIENLTEAWINYANKRFGTAVNAADVTTWDPSEAFPLVSHEEMYALLLEDELYETVKPLKGAVHYLQKLISDGHEVFIVTNSPYQVMKAKMENVLFRYFPFIDWKHVIITGNKPLIKGDVLIDDGVHNLQDGDYAKMLFTAPHNRDFDAERNGMVRVDGWKMIYNILSAQK
ncbi:MAG: HAD hydrolase-like protein [Oscillospiraceae bacterium]|nr:HAD hydrolase-like protein [Oscillospiraceae bacterium]